MPSCLCRCQQARMYGPRVFCLSKVSREVYGRKGWRALGRAISFNRLGVQDEQVVPPSCPLVRVAMKSFWLHLQELQFLFNTHCPSVPSASQSSLYMHKAPESGLGDKFVRRATTLAGTTRVHVHFMLSYSKA